MSRKSTKDYFTPSEHYLHGQVDYTHFGQMMIVEATGPFDAEIFPALNSTEAMLIKALAVAKWCQLVTFKESAIATPEAIEGFRDFIQLNYMDTNAKPEAIAFVIPDIVAGSDTMPYHYNLCYSKFPIEFLVFRERPDAYYWLLAKV